MQRVLEPEEIMTGFDQCREYYNVGREIIYDIVLKHLPDLSGLIADLGCGPAQIDKVLCDNFSNITIDAYDGSSIMLDIAREHIGNHDRINLINSRFEEIDQSYDTIISVNTLHHTRDPKSFWNIVSNISNKDAKIFVLDLCRPEFAEDIPNIVESTTDNCPDIFKEDYRNSLAAAFTEDEVRQQVQGLGLTVETIEFGSSMFKFIVVKN